MNLKQLINKYLKYIANHLRRERFDYTEWQKEYFAGIFLSEFNQEAACYDREHPFTKKQNPITNTKEN
jgi:hypothetical protein